MVGEPWETMDDLDADPVEDEVGDGHAQESPATVWGGAPRGRAPALAAPRGGATGTPRGGATADGHAQGCGEVCARRGWGGGGYYLTAPAKAELCYQHKVSLAPSVLTDGSARFRHLHRDALHGRRDGRQVPQFL